MATLSDARFDAMRTQGFTGATSDMLLQWLFANGATTAKTIPDAWREMLISQRPTADITIYQRNDWWFFLLGSLGYSGQLNDRELEFWLDGGLIAPQARTEFSNSFGSAYF